MLLLSQLTGTPNSRQAAQAYAEEGWLAECHHSLAWSRSPKWFVLLPTKWRRLLEKRIYPEIPEPALRRHPAAEFSLHLNPDPQQANQRFDHAIARRLQRRHDGLRAVHGYFDTSLHTFRAAKKRGGRAIYELPTPYWRAVESWLEPERQRHPQWSATLPSTKALHATGPQRDEELQQADLILVPSALVRDSLQLAPPFNAPVHVIPYGCPEATGGFPVLNDELRTTNREPLKLLFAGTLSQSKGLADLLAAIEPLGDRVELSLAGSPNGPLPHGLHPAPTRVRLLGQLPHEALKAEMRQHDVLALPTLYEGLSLTLLEAMAAGMAVITTTRSGLEGMVKAGQEAILLEPSQPEHLTQCLEVLMEHPSQLAALRSAARAWASEHSWTRYRSELREIVGTLL